MARDAEALLESLIGREIHTITGRPNTILRIDGDQVIVATGKSPNGQKVPVSWVEDALSRLVEDGSIEISVASVRYRSAFVGAVLIQLPGAEIDRAQTPPRIRLRSRRDA